jgi:hypothetical protein
MIELLSKAALELLRAGPRCSREAFSPPAVLENIRMPIGTWDKLGSNCHMAWISHFYWQNTIIFTESSALLQIVNDKVTRIRDQLKIIEDICCAFY